MQLYNRVKRDGKVEEFRDIIRFINSDKSIFKDEETYCKTYSYFLENDIITIIRKGFSSSFKFTETGKELKKYHQQMQE